MSALALALSLWALLRGPQDWASPSHAGHSPEVPSPVGTQDEHAPQPSGPTLRADQVPASAAAEQQRRIEKLEALVAQATDKLGWLARGQVQILYPRYPAAGDRTEATSDGTVAHFQRLDLPEPFQNVILVERLLGDGQWTRVRFKKEGSTLFAYLVERRSDELAPRDDRQQDGVFRVTLTSDK